MMNESGKMTAITPLFDPSAGMLVRSPLAEGPGWWAGAPSSAFDSLSNTFYLVYRLRHPRIEGRGMECRIAASDNGVNFHDIFALPKASIGALSLERASLLHCPDGLWRLYISYVCPQDGKWQIGFLEAREPDGFDINRLTPLLDGELIGAEGVKDPNVFQIGPMIYMLVSYATTEKELSPDEQKRRHASGDIYNTGLTLSRTGAAISGDGRNFQWIGDVSLRSNFLPLPVTPGAAPESVQPGAWDRYCRRLGSILPLGTGGFLGYYDGSSDVSENYEERTGLAMSFDLRHFYSLSPLGPVLTSPHASGSLRYVDVLPVGHELFYYYELARPDGSHELCVSIVERDLVA